MSEIEANCHANNIEFAVENGDASGPAMNLQAQIGAQCQANVVALRTLQAKLSTLTAGELLNGAMIHLYQPGAVSQDVTLRFRHVQTVGDPVVRVAVWVNRPKYLDHAVAVQMDLQADWGMSKALTACC